MQQLVRGGVLPLLRPAAAPPASRQLLATSAALHKRIGKRVRDVPEWRRKKNAAGPWWREPTIVMKSPLARTQHPEDRFAAAEVELSAAVAAAASDDLPLDMPDPYCPTPSTCILCPRK
jgi:hypothetical protein